MAIIVNNNKKIIDDAENLYINSSTIYVDEKEQMSHEKSKDNFTKFIDGDTREKKRFSFIDNNLKI